MSAELLSLKGVSHRFADHPVLHQLDLNLNHSEFLAILGASGCGKSTLLRIIAGLHTQDAGEIIMTGHTVCTPEEDCVEPAKRRVGFVFQDYALFPAMTVAENIAFGLKAKPQRWTARAIDERVHELLSMIGMQALAERYPHQLSGGQQQRTAIARALAPKPSLLLLDEPFANVDSGHRQILGEELRILVQHEKVGVIMVTHDRSEAFALADRVAMMQIGEHGAYISQCDQPENVYHKPVNRMIAEMAGTVSFLACEAAGNRVDTPLGEVALHNEHHGVGALVIRPEMLRWRTQPQGEFVVHSREYVGFAYRVKCHSRKHNISLLCYMNAKPDIGECGDLSLSAPCWFVAE